MLTLYIIQVGMYKYTVDCISVSVSIYKIYNLSAYAKFVYIYISLAPL